MLVYALEFKKINNSKRDLIGFENFISDFDVNSLLRVIKVSTCVGLIEIIYLTFYLYTDILIIKQNKNTWSAKISA